MTAEPTGRFTRADRIVSPREYRHIGRRGRRASDAYFVLLAAEGASGRRLGITVGRKVGNAVQRNRLKRRVREWFRCERGGLRSSVDLVVIARKEAAQLGFRELCEALDALAAQAGARA